VKCLYILRAFGLFHGNLVYLFSGYLVYFSRFGMLCQEQYGNSGVYQKSLRVSDNSTLHKYIDA
jgi:hypothetical protein